MARPTPSVPLLLALFALAGAAAADLPVEPDAWTEFADAAEAEAAGWYVTCGLSQQVWVDADCVCGERSVGCRNTQNVWNKRFGLARTAPLTGLQSVRFQQRCTWEEYDVLDWHVFLTMQPTPEEVDAGFDLKQLRWTYPKTTTWTETVLSVADAVWEWRVAASGMWLASGGNTQLTEMVAIEWYWNIWSGLPSGERKLIDDLAFVGTGTAVPDDLPRAPLLASVYPNPANPVVTVAIEAPRAGPVRVDVVDLRGRLVRRLHDAWLPAGVHQLRWHGRDARDHAAASGTYLVRVRTADGRDAGAITLAR